MNPKKNKTLLNIFVGIMVIGMIGIYVPMLFSSPVSAPTSADQNSAPDVSSVTPPPVEPTSTPTSTAPKPAVNGFSGLDEETKSLNNVGK